VGLEMMGFDSKGKQVGVRYNPSTAIGMPGEVETCSSPHESERKVSWNEITEDSAKIVTFIDLAGHEKYLRTTIYGLCGASPDYAMLMVGAGMGIIGTTKGTLLLRIHQ
jgi:GTPase